MRDHIFRKYDIRGIVGQELLIDQVYNFGRALAFDFIKRNPKLRTVVVGMDGRTHSSAIKNELARALLDSGLDVRFIGFCPTPVLYFSLYTLSVDAGVMITASHNEREYNGFKICMGKTFIWSHGITRLREFFKQKKRIISGRTGIYSKTLIVPLYITWLERAFAHLKGSSIKAVIDCGCGAASLVIPELVERMRWKNVRLIFSEIDGEFSKCTPDPTNADRIESLSDAIALYKADVGVGFDGDADRMVPMTDQGVLVPGDLMLALFSEAILKEHPGASVVFDSKCSLVLGQLLEKWGAQQFMTPTGHAAVKQKLQDTGALLAGELSSHFMFQDRYFGYDDGIYAMMRMFEVLHSTGRSLSDLIGRFPTTYKTGEIRIPCLEEDKVAIIRAVHEAFSEREDAEILTLDGVRVTTDYGWGIVRASNTQPVISFSCESATPEGFQRIKHDFDAALASSTMRNAHVPSRENSSMEYQQ